MAITVTTRCECTSPFREKKSQMDRPRPRGFLSGTRSYRSGQWQAAADSLETALRLRRPGDESTVINQFFLAMARWQLGEKDAARRQFAVARASLANKPIRAIDEPACEAEAAALLGERP